jgi:hypothetical protein
VHWVRILRIRHLRAAALPPAFFIEARVSSVQPLTSGADRRSFTNESILPSPALLPAREPFFKFTLRVNTAVPQFTVEMRLLKELSPYKAALRKNAGAVQVWAKQHFALSR